MKVLGGWAKANAEKREGRAAGGGARHPAACCRACSSYGRQHVRLGSLCGLCPNCPALLGGKPPAVDATERNEYGCAPINPLRKHRNSDFI